MNDTNDKIARQQRALRLAGLFERALIDRIAEQAKANGGFYEPHVPALIPLALDAHTEVCESEAEPVDSRLAVGVWLAVLKVNDSAFTKSLQAKEKAGTLGFQVRTGIRGKAAIYC